MGKITPGFKTILVFITFLGFTNLILSETKLDLTDFFGFRSAPAISIVDTSAEILEPAKAVLTPQAPIEKNDNVFKVASNSEVPEITLSSKALQICTGGSQVELSFSTTNNPTEYSINFDNSAFNDITNASLNASPIVISIPSQLGAGTYNASITVSNESGSSDPVNFTIQLKEIPNVNSVSDIDVCNTLSVNEIIFSGDVAGTTYSWTNNNSSIGLGTQGKGNIPTFNAVNPGTSPQTATIIVTPEADGCTGEAKTFTITVNPPPTVNTVPDIVVCNGAPVSAINFSGDVNETTFSWTNNTQSIGLATTGTGNITGFNAVNTGSTPVTATISVKPEANNCTGTEKTFTITVNPTPSVNDVSNIVICNGASVSAINFSGNVSGTEYSWSNNTPSIGLAASGTGNISAFNAVNSGNSPVTASITVTPTAAECTGEQRTFTITVNPTPTVNTVPDVVVCNGGSVSAINFSGGVTGTTYSWTNTTTSIGLAASGTANISTFNAVNTGNTPLTATIKVTPEANACGGEAKTFTITVNPTPTVNTVSNIVVCNGGSVSAINFGGNVDGTTFSWSNSTPSIGLAQSGTGNLPAFNAVNAGSSPLIATITVTPSANACTGEPKTFIITVNPIPTVNKPADVIACNDGTVNGISFSGSSVTGTTYRWENNNSNIGLSSSGSGNIAAFTAKNNTSTPLIATVTVYPVANGCEGSPRTFTITVNPPIVMQAPVITQPACFGESNGKIEITDVSGGNGDYRFSIDNSNFGSSKIFTGLTTGNYTIYIKDTQSCTFQQNIEIGEPGELSMTNPTFIPVTCFGGKDGTITAGTVTGGNGDYQYSIDNTNFTSSPNFTGVAAGTHTIFVKDSKNCSLQKSVIVTSPDVLKGTLSKTDVNCFGASTGEIKITNPTGGSGLYEYRINEQAWQASGNFSGLPSGNYKVSIRDKNNQTCIIVLQEVYQINQPAAALATTVTTTRTTVYGTATGSATANPTGGSPGYTYEWKRAGQTTQITKTATNLSAGVYELTVTDSKGCKLTTQVTIIDAIEAFILTRSTCEIEDSIDAIRTFHYIVEDGTAVGGVGPYTYSWDFGVDAINRVRSGIGEFWVDYSTIGNKTITLTVTDSTGEVYKTTQEQYIGKCYNPCGKSSNIEFDPKNIYIGYSNGTRILTTSPDYCDSNVQKFIFIQVDKSANIYNPYIELGFIISNDISEVTNHYYVSGCRAGADIDEDRTVNQPHRVGGFIKLTLNPIVFACGDNLNIDTFYTTWTNVSKKECGANNNKFCYSTNEPVFVPTELRAEATPSPILCKGDKTGTITVKASGGFAPYSYKLTENSTSQSNNQFVNLSAGVYTIYVEDAAGKKTTASATVIEPSTAITATTEVTQPSCFGETGEATVTATGGTPFTTGNPYKYLWNDSSQQTTAKATELAAGNYTVTIIDANGCQILKEVTITEPDQLTVAKTGEDIIYNCGFRIAELWANTPEKGVGTWTITSADNGGVIAEPNNPISSFTGNAGVHTLRWTIANQDGTCGSYSEVNVTFSQECSTLDFDGIDDYVFFDDNYGLISGAFTLEAWVKPNSLGGVKTVLSKRNSLDLSEGGYDLIINNGSPAFRWGASGSVSSSHKLNSDRWYHLAVIFKDNQVKLYVDGINLGTATSSNPKTIPHPFLVGAMFKDNKQDKPQNLFNGWIEEVRVWDTSLTEEQLRFLMNQRIKLNSTPLKGTVLPLNVPGSLQWTNLLGYYRMIGETVIDGKTLDEADKKAPGELRNINTTQQNTAPLPYVSVQNGVWRSKDTWLRPTVWDVPNGIGINGTTINWNIARVSHDITSGGHDITMLGLLSESGKLTVANPNQESDWQNSGQGLFITHYLKLDGIIDLVGESQLVQTDISTVSPIQTVASMLDESSKGYIERAQQGTANSYNYNYWSSPVSLQGAANNSTYTIGQVMLDGSATANYGKSLSFHGWHEFADGDYSTPRKISNYWLHKFRGTVNVYSEWKHIGSTGVLLAGEGYTMKGTSGNAEIEDRQNYVFKGKPNNGSIKLTVGKDQNYLLGNPYPSAIDINAFIRENLKDVTGGKNSQNIFNGAVYFWDHFAGKSHILKEYVGGYATRNLLDGVPAISNDERVNANDAKGSKIPGRYIPVGQGFFINTSLDPETSNGLTIQGGDVQFNNSQRAFVRESTGTSGNSLFLQQEKNTKTSAQEDNRAKIRLDFKSPKRYNRQILVGVDPNTTSGFDLGYDAVLNDNNSEDMYWLINKREYIIQGVPDFNLERILFLGIKIAQEGEFSIRINKLENIGDDVKIYLKDNETNSYYDLRKSDYKLNISPGTYHERFEIVFQIKKDTGESTPDEEEVSIVDPGEGDEKPEENPERINPEIFFLNKTNELVVKNPDVMVITQITLHSLSGQIIENYENIATQKEIRLPVRNYSSSVYLVKMYTETGIIHKKLIMNN